MGYGGSFLRRSELRRTLHLVGASRKGGGLNIVVLDPALAGRTGGGARAESRERDRLDLATRVRRAWSSRDFKWC